ncbi:O-antigen ligase family protein [Xylanimonas protaetiae]|uniref:O-antigen ligase domain-containing protein n=1 Tax=Xylanimonas protaetiae TaxID=2509457 RepID=A0A4P6FFY0_9MICO|nr:hypothetical protein [Xylanimonas protaetiae]QAY69508.1 hypothetical protein ET471_05170 [Xylanimonas protaetiae]
MTTPTLAARPTRRETAWIVAVAVALLAAAWALPPPYTGAAALLVAGLYLARGLLRRRETWLFLLVAVVMFVPIRRYAVPIPLPFALEPYRVLVTLTLLVVVADLLVNPAFRWRPVRFGVPVLVFLATMLVSVVVNIRSLSDQGHVGDALGGLVNLLIAPAVLVVVRQVARTRQVVTVLLTGLSWSGALIGLAAGFERATHVNVFLKLGSVLPLTLLRDADESLRAGGARAYGSAQHPIALAVLLCMLLPVGVYLARYAVWPRHPVNRRLFYAGVLACTLLGVAAAISRTAVVVLGTMFLLAAVLRPQLARLLFVVGVPVLLLGTVVQPKVFGSLVGSFLDPEELVASQYTSAGWTGAGRLADLGPATGLALQHPFFGTGVGSRVVVGDDANAFILDNQVLGTQLDAGALGVAGLAVLVIVPVVALLRHALRKDVPERDAMLAFALAASVLGYGVALFFYDAFGFLQTFLLLAILLAVGGWLLTDGSPPHAPVPVAREADVP